MIIIPEELLEKAKFLIEKCKKEKREPRKEAPQIQIDLPLPVRKPKD